MVENDDPDLSELEALDPKILESCTFEEGYFNPGGSDSEEDGEGLDWHHFRNTNEISGKNLYVMFKPKKKTSKKQ